jgi:anti-anti-sigma regulatory factor
MGPSEAAGRLRLENRLDSGVALVTVTGEIDVSTSALLREHLLRVITDEPRRSLVVNLARVSFIDSTGTVPCPCGMMIGFFGSLLLSGAGVPGAAPAGG